GSSSPGTSERIYDGARARYLNQRSHELKILGMSSGRALLMAARPRINRQSMPTMATVGLTDNGPASILPYGSDTFDSAGWCRQFTRPTEPPWRTRWTVLRQYGAPCHPRPVDSLCSPATKDCRLTWALLGRHQVTLAGSYPQSG